MWSSWFEEAKKKAEEAIKATSQVVSEVLTVAEISHCLGNESSEKQSWREYNTIPNDKS